MADVLQHSGFSIGFIATYIFKGIATCKIFKHALVMKSKTSWRLVSILAVGVGFYPLVYFVIDPMFGLLNSKSQALLNDRVWQTVFNAHILLGGLALLVGWPQFNARWRRKSPANHRLLGKIYVLSVMASGLAGAYLSFFATGGWVPGLGFFCLAAVWLFTTAKAYFHIKQGAVSAHQAMMIYSYASCFAAVTLRVWLPLLVLAHQGDFGKAYPLAAWLCWVPNLLVAYFIVRKTESRRTAGAVPA